MRSLWQLLAWGACIVLLSCARTAKEPVQPTNGGDTPDAPAPEAPETVSLERYPRIVMPSQVAVQRKTTVFVGLTEAPGGGSAAAVVIEGSGEQTDDALVLQLPELPEGTKTWPIDVILSAPDFTIEGDDLRTIQLPKTGPSTMARYELTLNAVPTSGKTDVQAYLFHQGAFMGHLGRTVDAVEEPTATVSTTEQVATFGTGVRTAGASHEIHLLSLDDTRALVVINQPGKTMAHTVVDFDRAGLPSFLTPKFAAIRARGLERNDADPVGMGMVKGLGAQLWSLVPIPVQRHLEKIYGDDTVGALRIYTNVPAFPWELVRPVDDDGEALEPLGTRFRLGRWHLRMGMSGLTVPPTRIDYRELVAMVPTYEGQAALPAVQRELTALQSVSGFRRVPGVSASVAELVRNPPNGVIHFAGHGDAQATDGAATRYALRLEDGAFDSTAFVGLDDKRLREKQTLIFFNACELGQADATANIVEGWAPAMLDAGASGYIGALWPVGDDEAAAFAEAFYEEVEGSIRRFGSARVTEILRCLRTRGASRQDPTWQAYVFYGDPSTVLYREAVTPTEPDGQYTCEPAIE